MWHPTCTNFRKLPKIKTYTIYTTSSSFFVFRYGFKMRGLNIAGTWCVRKVTVELDVREPRRPRTKEVLRVLDQAQVFWVTVTAYHLLRWRNCTRFTISIPEYRRKYHSRIYTDVGFNRRRRISAPSPTTLVRFHYGGLKRYSKVDETYFDRFYAIINCCHWSIPREYWNRFLFSELIYWISIVRLVDNLERFLTR